MSKSVPFLRPFHETILIALCRYHFLTVEQVQRGWGTPGGLSRVKAFLKQLADWDYVQADLWLSRSSRYGRSPTVYNLAANGLAYLHEIGKSIERRYRPSDYKLRSHYALAHTLAVNDFLIAAQRFARRTVGVELVQFQHERELKQQPFKTKDKDGRALVFAPDAWIDLRVTAPDGIYQEAVEVEIDRGTEDQRRWQAKIRAILVWAGKPYQQQFGTDVLTLAIVAVRGDDQADSDEARAKRVENLRRWTEAVLAREGKQRQAALFCFVGVDPARVPPDELFSLPVWSQPFSSTFTPLLTTHQEHNRAA